MFTPAQLSHEVVSFDERLAAEAATPLNRQLLGLSIEFVSLFMLSVLYGSITSRSKN